MLVTFIFFPTFRESTPFWSILTFHQVQGEHGDSLRVFVPLRRANRERRFWRLCSRYAGFRFDYEMRAHLGIEGTFISIITRLCVDAVETAIQEKRSQFLTFDNSPLKFSLGSITSTNASTRSRATLRAPAQAINSFHLVPVLSRLDTIPHLDNLQILFVYSLLSDRILFSQVSWQCKADVAENNLREFTCEKERRKNEKKR